MGREAAKKLQFKPPFSQFLKCSFNHEMIYRPQGQSKIKEASLRRFLLVVNSGVDRDQAVARAGSLPSSFYPALQMRVSRENSAGDPRAFSSSLKELRL